MPTACCHTCWRRIRGNWAQIVHSRLPCQEIRLVERSIAAADPRELSRSALRRHHPASAQPVDQLARIARIQHVIESIVLAPALESLVLRDEMQVVIAEYRERALAELAHIAQHVERFRAAIDQVAYKP